MKTFEQELQKKIGKDVSKLNDLYIKVINDVSELLKENYLKCQHMDCDRPSCVKIREGFHFINVCKIHLQGKEFDKNGI